METPINSQTPLLGNPTHRCIGFSKANLIPILLITNLVILSVFVTIVVTVVGVYRPEITKGINLIKHFDQTSEIEYITARAYDLAREVNTTEVKELFQRSNALVGGLNPRQLDQILRNTTILFGSIGNVSNLGHMIVSTEKLVKKICYILKC